MIISSHSGANLFVNFLWMAKNVKLDGKHGNRHISAQMYLFSIFKVKVLLQLDEAFFIIKFQLHETSTALIYNFYTFCKGLSAHLSQFQYLWQNANIQNSRPQQQTPTSTFIANFRHFEKKWEKTVECITTSGNPGSGKNNQIPLISRFE